jgi:hypothetical protein
MVILMSLPLWIPVVDQKASSREGKKVEVIRLGVGLRVFVFLSGVWAMIVFVSKPRLRSRNLTTQLLKEIFRGVGFI